MPENHIARCPTRFSIDQLRHEGGSEKGNLIAEFFTGSSLQMPGVIPPFRLKSGMRAMIAGKRIFISRQRERELMLYQLRLKDGKIDPFSSGTLIEKNGAWRHLKRDEFQIEVLEKWRSPRSKANYPSRWKVAVPREKIALKIVPTVADQELDTQRSTGVTYWEGSVRVTGTQSGKGYVEMTGYAEEFNGTF